MPDQTTGFIHSLESFGTVDGPGCRLVVFLQGCPLRCLYCHNPDTWNTSGGKPVTADEILADYTRNEPFYRNGGITVTGGEPLLQIDFVTELFKKAKKRGIHTCIDTSGITFLPKNEAVCAKFDTLMTVTDLVMLDIKHSDPEGHKKLTGAGNENILAFSRYLTKKQIPVWIRHVVVPGITDTEEEWRGVGKLMAEMPNVKALDVLPYHTLGLPKYEALGLDYPLKGIDPLPASVAAEARNVILDARRDAIRSKRSHAHSE